MFLVLIKCFVCHFDVKTKMTTNKQLWECENLMTIMTTQLRLLVYSHTQLWSYALTHHQAPLQTLVQHHNHDNNEHTYHSIAIRHVAANKYIQKFWKQTIALDASLCYAIITMFYITLTSKIMSINVTYLDILVSNIPITPRHGLFGVCSQPIRACIAIQHRLWLSERTQNDPYKASKCNVV